MPTGLFPLIKLLEMKPLTQTQWQLQTALFSLISLSYSLTFFPWSKKNYYSKNEERKKKWQHKGGLLKNEVGLAQPQLLFSFVNSHCMHMCIMNNKMISKHTEHIQNQTLHTNTPLLTHYDLSPVSTNFSLRYLSDTTLCTVVRAVQLENHRYMHLATI